MQIAASLLLFTEEEDAFWMLCTVIEDLLPASYYSSTLIGVQVPSAGFVDVNDLHCTDCLASNGI